MTSPLYFRTWELCCTIGLRVVGYYIQHRQKPIDLHLLSPLRSRIVTNREHSGVVKILLAWANINSDERDNDDRSPLWSAARNEHNGVVKMLLRREDNDPTNQKMTAIHRSIVLLGMDTSEWWKYYSGETASTLTNQIILLIWAGYTELISLMGEEFLFFRVCLCR